MTALERIARREAAMTELDWRLATIGPPDQPSRDAIMVSIISRLVSEVIQ